MSTVTRAAVETGFERFVEDAVEATYEAFSVRNALGGGDRPPGLTDRLLKRTESIERSVVRPELAAYRERVLAEFAAALDALESDEPFETHRAAVLEHDAYAQALRDDLPPARRAAVRDALFERQRALAADVEPLVAHPSDDFWTAVEGAFTREEALAFVDARFEFTEPLARYPDAFRFAARLDPGEVLGGVGGLLAGGLPTLSVEFTDEARRAMERAETHVQEDARRRIRRQFDA